MTAIVVKSLSIDIPIFDVASTSLRHVLLRRAVGGQMAQAGRVFIISP